MIRFTTSLMMGVGVGLVAVAASAGGVACSSAETRAAEEPTVADGGATEGGGDRQADASSDATSQSDAPAAARDYAADVCGNGIDDDGNGRIDEACPVVACKLALSEPIPTTRSSGIAVLRGAGEFLAYGGEDTVANPAVQRFVSGVVQGPSVPLEPERGQLEALSGIPFVLAPAPSPALVRGRKLDPVTLAPGGDWLAFPSAATPAPSFAPAQLDMVRSRAVNGSVWAVVHPKDSPKLRVARLDATMAMKASYEIDLIGHQNLYEVLSLGGMPYVYDRTVSSTSSEWGFRTYTRLTALGDSKPRFVSEAFLDDWGSDVLSWGGGGHLTVAQALDKVMVCRGGPRERPNKLPYAHVIGCHVLSAATGATLGSFSVTGYALSDVLAEIKAAPHGADFLLARAGGTGSSYELHIDRLTVSGVLTKDVVPPVSIPSSFIDGITETAPNEYAIVYRTETNPGVVSVRTLKCAP